ncbi:MAG: chromosome segregation protein SMC [Bdellovibrionales bacterium]|nr:chromosome segregation protein SMC [Bdellovibrionales bacterium]
MRIKKLELIGFKSFKDRTVIQFDAGITGVVGPNGCGKSNIVDALVWVMGEMSAKHLRGSSMEDVIFAGAEGYAPMGMCEVSLTLENDGGPFPVKYLNHSEVMITRRLHRSGESEYLINKEPARLRDIHEIFMDTGAGSKGFSIIEQGAIGKIVTAKPEDRRVLIEEAAGITKFKARKRESQRKLTATEANLVRLQDIIGELKRQLDSLQRQAQRAERYRKLKKEMEDIDLWLSSKEFVELHQRVEDAQTAFNEAQSQEIESQSGLTTVEAELAELRAGSLEGEKVIEDFRIGLKTNQDSVREKENLIQELRFEIEQAKRSKEMAGSLYDENRIREQAILNDYNQVVEKLASVERLAEELKTDYETQKGILAERKERIESADNELSDKRRELLTVSGAETETRAKQGSLQEAVANLDREVNQARTVLDELQIQKEEFEKNRTKVFNQFESERQMQMEIMNDVESLQASRDEMNADFEKKEADVLQYKDKLNEVVSRLYGLENLRDNFEGFQEGVKSVMFWQKQNLESLPEDQRQAQESFRPLSEVVQVPEKFEVALEAALGPKLQMLISNDDEKSLQAVDYLKQQKSGRSTFYSGQNMLQTHDGSETSMVQQCRGVECLLTDVIQIPEKHTQVVNHLLDKVAVVENIRDGIELHGQFPAWTFVTLEGDVFTREGMISGGHAADASSGVLKRQREIKELQLAKEEWSGKLALAQTAMKALQAKLKQVSDNLEKAQQDQKDKDILIAGLKKDLERAEAEVKNAEQAFTRQESSLDQSLQRQADKLKEYEELTRYINEMTEKKNALTDRIEELGNILETEKLGIGDLQDKVTELQVESAKKHQELIGVRTEHERLERTLNDVREQMNKMDAETSKNTQSMSENQVLMEEKKVELENLIQKVSEQEAQLSKMRNEFETSNARMFELQEQVSGMMSEKNRLQSIMNDSQLVLEQAKMKEQNLLEHIEERYQKNLAEIAHQYADREGDADASREEMKSLKEKLNRIGEVNLSAIEEYDELADRYEFLSKQYNDLIEAKDQLRKVIDRINRICSKRFKETFEAVNERFQRVFPVLFGGGEARLILIEDPEKGEMGIDIVSKPPGKKLQSVSLLSGGEKALTAVSLIFSIFLVKPSPYCLLDEVDAPLDDANVMRFNDLVREMAKRSQIIVVTHNKYTMEIAEKLYGVTMEEKGVSKMVSVDLGAADLITAR